MKCPFCGYTESKVVDSRPTDEDARIRRRRECLSCARRFTTYEVIETVPIVVVKQDGSREEFDHDKLLRGMLRACEKRPVSIQTLEEAVRDIEAQIQNSLDREVAASQIGEYAMDALKKIDEVAYVRFASVYRHFKDISSFQEAIAQLLKDN
ncbi:MAG: transcriptional regulator NrdR [Clostridia bacterium]|nr:transcriptional regulator NrdR [Clostridia bacterium]MBQ2940096.1 transcriptional regulator NrdR [Clostridia bacterium]